MATATGNYMRALRTHCSVKLHKLIRWNPATRHGILILMTDVTHILTKSNLATRRRPNSWCPFLVRHSEQSRPAV